MQWGCMPAFAPKASNGLGFKQGTPTHLGHQEENRWSESKVCACDLMDDDPWQSPGHAIIIWCSSESGLYPLPSHVCRNIEHDWAWRCRLKEKI